MESKVTFDKKKRRRRRHEQVVIPQFIKKFSLSLINSSDTFKGKLYIFALV